MRKLGRCGRQRRSNHKDRISQGISQTHQPEYVILLQWMKTTIGNSQWKSSCWHCLEPAYFKDTGRGLRATKNFRPGEAIISIPLQFLITTSTVFDSDIGAVLLKENKQLTPQQLLTIFLVIERYQGDKSPWFPYINTLPQTYSTPLYFSKKEMNLLTPYARSSAVQAEERFNKAFDIIKTIFQNSLSSFDRMCNESDIKWAWSTVNTRSVYFQTFPHPILILDPEESHLALAPFLDLLNHLDSSKMSAGINARTNCYDIVTLDTYKKHEQVFICYGAHDNVKLLINYGFTLQSNINNSYIFTLDEISACLLDHIQYIDRKVSIVKEAQMDKNLACTVDGVSWSLMTTLKIFALQWKQLSLWKKLIQGATLSEENDKQAHEMASKLIKAALIKAQKHLEFVNTQPQSTNFDLLISLSLDDVHILEGSLSSLRED
uniref:SET domain-containing protein n=2 Tax=Arion vulgaris TaxID=1028688 RepID=A0A0B6ZUH9_9EUPU